MSTENTKQEGLYYYVIDGTFRRRVADETPGATKREYETKEGNKAVKYEMVIDSLEGYIEDLQINDGDFGRQLSVKLDPNHQNINPMLQFSVETTYGEDVLKKLPNIDFTKPVKFRPYSFNDQDREVRGVEISQGEKKYKNFFWDNENKQPLHGHPEVPENARDTFTKDDWKMHFLGVRKFLIAYFTDVVRPRMLKEVGQREQVGEKTPAETYPEEEINPEDIPF